MQTAYVLLNSDLGSDETIISKIKEILDNEKDIKYEVQGVYGGLRYRVKSFIR